MPTVLIEYTREAREGAGYREATSLYRPAPLLEAPTLLPQSVWISEKDKKYDLCYGERHHSRSQSDELTEYARGPLGKWFGNVTVEHVDLNGSNIPIVDSFSNHTKFAVGPRLEMIQNRYGAGGLILHLLAHAPMTIFTPGCMEWELKYILGESHSSGCYPSESWVDHDGGVIGDNPVIPDLPPKLNRIVRECLEKVTKKGILKNAPISEDLCDYTSVFPIGICTWHGFEPMQSKSTKRIVKADFNDSDFRLEDLDSYPGDWGCRDDGSWMVLDRIIRHIMESGATVTCCPIVHTDEEMEQIITDMVPFGKLLEYISHDRFETKTLLS
jgi:hypothetical protein